MDSIAKSIGSIDTDGRVVESESIIKEAGPDEEDEFNEHGNKN